MTTQFKKCSKCNYIWPGREDFLRDKKLEIIGYQVSEESLGDGLFLFNHNCGTTLALKVENFLDLYDGSIFEERLSGSDGCPGFCLYVNNIEPCPSQCEYAHAREIIQFLRRQPEVDSDGE